MPKFAEHWYFSSDKFCYIDYWEIHWRVRQFHYFRYIKMIIEDIEYGNIKEPKLPESESVIKNLLAEFARYAEAERQRLNIT